MPKRKRGSHCEATPPAETDQINQTTQLASSAPPAPPTQSTVEIPQLDLLVDAIVNRLKERDILPQEGDLTADLPVAENGQHTLHPDEDHISVQDAIPLFDKVGESQATGSQSGCSAYQGSKSPLKNLSLTARKIITATLKPCSRKAYILTWKKLQQYFTERGENPHLPLHSWQIVNFLADMFERGYSSSTISSHASAISFMHKYLGFRDTMDSFLLRKFLKGIGNLAVQKDARLPISLTILKRIIDAIPLVINRSYDQMLLKALFTLMFCMFLRMGEVCVSHGGEISNVIQRQDVRIVSCSTFRQGVSVCMRQFKHKKDTSPVTLYHECNSSDSINPAHMLKNYFHVFTHTSGPLFQFLDGSPVTYSYAAEKLKLIISFLGLDPSKYKPHSFRIGAATAAVQMGLSEEEVKRFGRWHSNALQNYIRLPKLVLK